MSFEYQAALNAETSAAHGRFDELLDFVIETTLTNRSPFQETLAAIETVDRASDPTKGTISQLGLWATIRAVEAEVAVEPELIELLHDADRALLPFDDRISNKIEAFGRTLLNEAFDCLGKDAAEQAAKYRASTSPKERMDICDWLIGRLWDINNKGFSAMNPAPEPPQPPTETVVDPARQRYVATQPERHKFYHPARLAPRLIGYYPEIELEPTCLGVSILAASFFERAGVPYLHCGVARTAGEEARTLQIQSLIATDEVAESKEIPISDQLIDKFQKVIDHEQERLAKFNGFHAAIMSYINDETWVQLDVNYRCNILIDDEDSQKLTKLHQSLTDRSRSAPGLEFAIEPSESSTGSTLYYKFAIKHVGEKLTSVDEADAFLASLTPESALECIYNEYFMDFFNPERSGVGNVLITPITAYYCAQGGLNQSRYLQSVAYGVLLDYVFADAADGDITASVERCHRDAAYRRRRAEELALTPIYMLLALQSRHGNAVIQQDITLPHNQLDGGLPAYRVGAAVLSDFASYCGDELPLSFWLTYWPSSVSLAEHFQQCDSPAQKELRAQIASDILSEPLKYGRVDDIVTKVHE